MQTRNLLLLIPLGVLFNSTLLQGALAPSKIFSDHMVLQRDRPIPVFGSADPGAKVTVSIEGRDATATADASGKWRVDLPALPVGSPHTLKVESGNEKIEFKDVLMGEVWLSSGQSNMELWMRDAGNATEEIAVANFPDIRLLNVAQRPEDEPVTDLKARGWEPVTPQNITFFSAVTYYFGRELHRELKVPIGLISSSVGATVIETWTPFEKFQNNPAYDKILERREKIIKERPTYTQLQIANGALRNGAGFMYNGMIAPIIPYGIRGVIWYQGESDAGRAEQYKDLFPKLITSWREKWGAGDFPFYFVQLANFEGHSTEPEDHAWAELREAQSKTLSVPNTGMAIAIDIGDPKTIHPKNKQEVGRRLALIALANSYGKKTEYSGPVFQAMKPEGKVIRLEFSHITGGLKTKDGSEPKAFAVAGPDRKFYWATAKIESNAILLTSPELVPNPVAVRYAWDGNPDANLVNGEGLPASPFRTDDWPGIMAGKQ